jgi:hypothetical protein
MMVKAQGSELDLTVVHGIILVGLQYDSQLGTYAILAIYVLTQYSSHDSGLLVQLKMPCQPKIS